ncbi:MAG TPA: SpoIIIAH-like family protein [Candidatus Ornithomonoglobus merdipullorum]|uniref:SpoIIIAH-like family protein n=1 Tax=Candidatus Ornithomonoglobus merdipullorum TaxID=2840895 RepID=A0A9D1MBT4_9FIRM|nr:SpoIIIAH-like family protein [Candidatus Ornithomonoglobus merdipullorum]
MMILKKKEIIAASLVVLIGMAGYLNWSYQDTVRVRDNESYVETGKTLGEAEMVSADNSAEETTAAPGTTEAAETAESANASGGEEAPAETENAVGATQYFEEAKMNRESARASATEMLKATSADESIDEATRALAGEKLIACAADIELENQIESIAAAKGYSEVCAYINEGAATLAVRSEGLDGDDIAKLTDIVTGSSEIPADSVRIVEVK